MTAQTYDRPPVVLVDMDGVQADIEAAFWSQWAARHPDAPQRTAADTSAFHLEDQLPAIWQPQVREIVNTPGFYRHLPVIAGARQALNAMLEAGWDVVVCTAPLLSNPTCASDKLAWMEQYIGEGWSRRTVIAKDKGRVRGDLLIDDKPIITGALTPTWKHVVFDAAYNRNSPSPHRLTAWDDWESTLTPLLGRIAA